MLGLLIKDLFNTRKQAVWYVAMIILFSVLSVVMQNVAFCATLGILVTVSMPLTAVAYEEKAGWQKCIVAGGMSLKVIVAEKYLLGLSFALLSSVAYSVVFSVIGAEGGAAEFISPICMQFIALAVVLPIIFKFGVEKGRVYMIVLILILMVALIALMPFIGDALAGNQAVFISCAVCATVIMFVASFIISVRIYTKKEF